MAFVRVLSALLRDKQIGRHIVPIVPDESRTFGMEGLFRQVGIYSPFGQRYQPQDSEQLMFYKEDEHGQILEEGITEAGSISSFIAAGTSYSAHAVQTVPFYIYYSMFGYQRVGDLVWAAADSRTRGFMLGGTAGRTTLNGEGLQHEDGHSHVLFSVVPNCRAYDPAFGYEVAVIVQDGPAPDGRRAGGRLLLPDADERELPPPGDAGRGGGRNPARDVPTAVGLRLGPARTAARFRDDPARGDWQPQTAGVGFRRGRRRVERDLVHRAAARRHRGGALEHAAPDGEPTRRAYVATALGDAPTVAATDYIRAYADQIRQWVPGSYRVLGTDGFGRSDYRRALRRFFEVDRQHVVRGRADRAVADAGRSIGASSPRRSSDSTSTPRPRCRRAYERHRGRHLGRGAGHRRLRRRAGDRDPGLAGRHGRARRSAVDARVRQGDDGRARAVQRRRAGGAGEGGRPGLAGHAAADHVACRGNRVKRQGLGDRLRRRPDRGGCAGCRRGRAGGRAARVVPCSTAFG